jgi:protein-tyrosine phosphatase
MSDLPRHLKLEGASNFRDVGGYPASDGRSVRWRRIFRSNHLGHLTDADIKIVRGLGVRSAFDFRGTEERTAAVCKIEEILVHSLPIEPTVVAALRARLQARALSSADAPLVIHCTAGKDRTGFACALVLHALGVPDAVISEDYLLTNHFYRRDPNASPDLPDHVRQAIGSVEPSFLAAGFEAVRADYGDLESYFRDGLKLGPREREEIKARYLAA